MGDQVLCKLRFGSKTFSGKALLETSEIVFRGDTRLKIPFSSIKSVQVEGGALHIRIPDGLAIFELGPKAQKWHDKIANPKTLLEKLGIQPGDSVRLDGDFPADFLVALKKRGATLVSQTEPESSAWVFLAAESVSGLRRVSSIAKALRGASALWIVYPKGQKSITEADVRSAGLKSGLTDVKVAGFSATHTALKFVIPKSKR
ncbi:MAG TPA: hypothetical protein VMH31_03960 [Methylomirabilota bacterium]|nr:hypothetical protein [Methylomirabilota bacterium]